MPPSNEKNISMSFTKFGLKWNAEQQKRRLQVFSLGLDPNFSFSEEEKNKLLGKFEVKKVGDHEIKMMKFDPVEIKNPKGKRKKKGSRLNDMSVKIQTWYCIQIFMMMVIELKYLIPANFNFEWHLFH